MGDVATIIYEWMGATEPNRFVVKYLDPLIDMLQELTAELEPAVAAVQSSASGEIEEQLAAELVEDLEQWKARLEVYDLAMFGQDPDERENVLWTVSAPLIMGIWEDPKDLPPGIRTDDEGERDPRYRHALLDRKASGRAGQAANAALGKLPKGPS